MLLILVMEQECKQIVDLIAEQVQELGVNLLIDRVEAGRLHRLQQPIVYEQLGFFLGLFLDLGLLVYLES